MLNISFRKVEPDDVDALLGISKQTFFDAFEKQNNPNDFEAYASKAFTIDKLNSELANPASVFYFATDGEEIVGYVKLNFADAQTEFNDPEALEIERIYVLKSYQGKKIGELLLQHAVGVAQNNHLNTIWLGVWEHNVNAIRFYERHGFKTFGSHEFMLGTDRQTDILMKEDI